MHQYIAKAIPQALQHGIFVSARILYLGLCLDHIGIQSRPGGSTREEAYTADAWLFCSAPSFLSLRLVPASVLYSSALADAGRVYAPATA